MRKLRSDAIWNQLTREQRAQLEEWLFEQNLSYRETHERSQKELGMNCSAATIGRIYQLILRRRAASRLTAAQGAAEEMAATGAKLEDLRSSSMKLIGARLLQKCLEEGELKEVTALARVLLQSEEREIQRERAKLARDRFEHQAAKAALKALPLADEMAAEDEARERARLEEIKVALFGQEVMDAMQRPPKQEAA